MQPAQCLRFVMVAVHATSLVAALSQTPAALGGSRLPIYYASAAPAPAFAPAAPLQPPAAGSLLLRVRGKLSTEHRTLANITQDLLTINSDVESAEQELLGRVLNVEDAKRMTVMHKETDASIVKSREELRKLNEQIDILTAQLTQAQLRYASEGHSQDDETLSLTVKLNNTHTAMSTLEVQANELPQLELYHKELETHHEAFEVDKAKSFQKGDDVTRALNEVQLAIQKEAAEEQRLRKALQDVHQYNMNCHERSEQLQKEVRVLASKVPAHSAAEEAAAKHTEAAAKASLQRLSAEGALLKAEIVRAEDASKAAITSLKDARHELTLLEQHMIAEVQKVHDNMTIVKAHTSLLEQSVKDNIAKEDEDIGRRRGLDKELESLKKRISPVVYAALKAENEALQMELAQSTYLLEQSKVAEARAYANVSQLEAQVEAEKQAAAIAANSTTAAHEEGQKQLSDAVSAAAVGKAKAAETLAKARQVIVARCSPEWDKISEEKDKEVQACRSLQEELAVVNAQRDTLTETLKAQHSGVDETSFQ